ncbi:HlyD family type I secretion periplasmic adaptor subunit [Geminicoccaceae bacterium 1502E]|nr:HlyD family type I secretion periplasmic adaptor subunit [Geminicoccaceae bacterium 1502E]
MSRGLVRRSRGVAAARPLDRELAEFVAGAAGADRLRPHGLGHLLLAAVALFFVVFLVWADWATLDEVTRGTGKVIPSRHVQVVQNLEGGIVDAILVRDGEIVEAGQVLMRIDNVRSASEYREKKARHMALLAARARLEAEIGGEALQFPQEVLEEAPEIARNETRLFESRRRQLDSELEILASQAQQRAQELEELKSRLEQYERSYRLANEELRVTEPLAAQRIVARTELLQLQRQVNDLRGALEQTRLSLPRAEEALREARRRTENARSRFAAEAQAEYNQRSAELAGLREILAAGYDRVRRTDVRSPVRGTVKRVRVTTVGGVIQPGQDLVEIVPLEDTLLVEANVRPADIAFLRPDLPATVKITAYDYAIYGGLDGVVEEISADTIANEKGESFYRVRVRTNENHLGPAAHPLEIIPGMTAQVDVLTGEKTVLDYLLKPILKARQAALTER